MWKPLSRVQLCDPTHYTQSLSSQFSRSALCSPWNSPGQNTGVGSLSLLQEIFPTQGSNPGLPHCRWILYQLSHKGSPEPQAKPVNQLTSQQIWRRQKLEEEKECSVLVQQDSWCLLPFTCYEDHKTSPSGRRNGENIQRELAVLIPFHLASLFKRWSKIFLCSFRGRIPFFSWGSL